MKKILFLLLILLTGRAFAQNEPNPYYRVLASPIDSTVYFNTYQVGAPAGREQSKVSLKDISTYANSRINSVWSLNGNSGANYFLGTTSNNSFALKVNATQIAYFDSGAIDIKLGYGAGIGVPIQSVRAQGNTFLGFNTCNGGNMAASTCVGSQAGLSSRGDNIVCVGMTAGYNAGTMTNGISIGYAAGQTATNSSDCIFIGTSAGLNDTNSVRNIYIGKHTGITTYNSHDNVVIGTASGQSGINTYSNTIVGDSANTVGSIHNASAIGSNSRVAISNAIVLGDTTNIKVGIGTGSPTTLLHVKGASGFKYVDGNQSATKYLKSDANGVASWAALTGVTSVAMGVFIKNTPVNATITTTGTINLDTATASTYYLRRADTVSLVAPFRRAVFNDSLVDLVTGTVSLTSNSIHIITASGTITSTTIAFPTGVNRDEITVIFTKAITSITGITGAGTGTVVMPAVLIGTSRTFKNYNGLWY